MKRSKPRTILLCIAGCLATSGCSLLPAFLSRPVYVKPGAMVEVAETGSLTCWYTNAKTGMREKGSVEVQPGMYVVRPRIEEFGLAPAAPALTAPEIK